ncbi:MAG: C45 family peptidase [Saprospiraceae bacterium]
MMNKWLKRIGIFLLSILGVILLLLLSMGLYIHFFCQQEAPDVVAYQGAKTYQIQQDSGLTKYGPNWFRESNSGLYEMYVEGNPYERGLAIGQMSKPLIQYQEEVFTAQLRHLIPATWYLNFLKYVIGWFNRNIGDDIPEEFKVEILGVSKAASEEFDFISPPYGRMLNYHAAHDIGHALQNMALVGCTSFATWGKASADSSLIIGRNFDFYVGDDFAKNKIIAFYKPERGIPFMMVTFGGMTGVLSGMNALGLTLTLNAAKSEIPGSAATPISLIAREVLQYASTIEEANQIIQKRHSFVAESFMIGSAKDGKAALIEKTPSVQARFDAPANRLISTNHFQSKDLGTSPLNLEFMANSSTVYRYDKVLELLRADSINTVTKTARILRDQKGLEGKDIGMGNEKSINQLIAHHSIIFQPEKGKVWISTAPWQLGKYVCYDLNKIFAMRMDKNQEIAETSLEIPQDSFVMTNQYANAVKFNSYRFPFSLGEQLNPDSIIAWNPNSYHAYLLAGKEWEKEGQFAKAQQAFSRGLGKEIASKQEEAFMKEHMEHCDQEIQKQK